MHQSSVKPRMVPSPSSMHNQNLVALRASCYPCTFPSISLAYLSQKSETQCKKQQPCIGAYHSLQDDEDGIHFWMISRRLDRLNRSIPNGGRPPPGKARVNSSIPMGWFQDTWHWVNLWENTWTFLHILTGYSWKPTKEQFLATPVRDPEHKSWLDGRGNGIAIAPKNASLIIV